MSLNMNTDNYKSLGQSEILVSFAWEFVFGGTENDMNFLKKWILKSNAKTTTLKQVMLAIQKDRNMHLNLKRSNFSVFFWRLLTNI